MNKALGEYINFMQSVADYDLNRLDNFIAADIRFVDPFNDSIGLQNYVRIIEDMRRQISELRIEVLEHANTSENRALLRWRLGGRLNAFKRRPWQVEGCARLTFDGLDLLAEHIDYWDAAGGLYETLPIIGGLMRYLRKRLAVVE